MRSLWDTECHAGDDLPLGKWPEETQVGCLSLEALAQGLPPKGDAAEARGAGESGGKTGQVTGKTLCEETDRTTCHPHETLLPTSRPTLRFPAP